MKKGAKLILEIQVQMFTSCNNNIDVILLAAGGSFRMGRLKQTLSWNNKTLLENCLDSILQAKKIDNVMLVLGNEAQQISEKLHLKIEDNPDNIISPDNCYLLGSNNKQSLKRLFWTVNANWENGMASSLVHGLKALLRVKKSQNVMIAFGDMPYITPLLVDEIICQHEKLKMGITVPTFNSSSGHPVIFSCKYFAQMLELSGDKGAKSIVISNPLDVNYCKVNSDAILKDFDTYDSYCKALELNEGGI